MDNKTLVGYARSDQWNKITDKAIKNNLESILNADLPINKFQNLENESLINEIIEAKQYQLMEKIVEFMIADKQKERLLYGENVLAAIFWYLFCIKSDNVYELNILKSISHNLFADEQSLVDFILFCLYKDENLEQGFNFAFMNKIGIGMQECGYYLDKKEVVSEVLVSLLEDSHLYDNAERITTLIDFIGENYNDMAVEVFVELPEYKGGQNINILLAKYLNAMEYACYPLEIMVLSGYKIPWLVDNIIEYADKEEDYEHESNKIVFLTQVLVNYEKANELGELFERLLEYKKHDDLEQCMQTIIKFNGLSLITKMAIELIKNQKLELLKNIRSNESLRKHEMFLWSSKILNALFQFDAQTASEIVRVVDQNGLFGIFDSFILNPIVCFGNAYELVKVEGMIRKKLADHLEDEHENLSIAFNLLPLKNVALDLAVSLLILRLGMRINFINGRVNQARQPSQCQISKQSLLFNYAPQSNLPSTIVGSKKTSRDDNGEEQDTSLYKEVNKRARISLM